MTREWAAMALMVSACGCGGAQPEPQEFPDASDPAYAASFDGERDPRVSTSAGSEGGVVVLWPRIVPGTGAEELRGTAADLQRALTRLAERALPDRPVDVRPDPQRVCPRSGCAGVALGAVLLHSGSGCAAAATVARPGETPTFIVPWTDGISRRAPSVPFREPPESLLQVRDFVPCEGLADALANDEAIEEQVRLAVDD